MRAWRRPAWTPRPSACHNASMLVRTQRRAFTLIELMIVIGMIVVLAALGVGAISELVPRFRARQAAEQFGADVEMMRMMAIMNDRETRIVVTDYDTDPYGGDFGNGAWALYVGNRSLNSTFWDQLPYEGTNGVDSYNGEGSRDLATGTYAAKSVALAEPDVTAIVFNARGWVNNDATDFGYSPNASSIDFEFTNTAAATGSANPDNYIVKVFRGGMVRIEAGLGDEFTTHSAGTNEASSAP
ncbi:MAG: prepilin-type N-terminal cleavage/methylation domain-containing protein [Cognaticolwellia sp.]|jgi:prepilin-type N-terminal cleavage/methylation domain-containing protein